MKKFLLHPMINLSKGLYTVRKGGMERFSNRNAVDLMVNVLELTRDEVAAFSVFNRDKLRDLLGEMSDKMKGMIKKLRMLIRILQKMLTMSL